jgi:SAM-dependent methyltransferase
MSQHDHDADHGRGEDFWNERYRSLPRVWSGNPNPQLVAEIADLVPGRALDVGCGEGADAIWLAGRGWDVVATDISSIALERAAQHARESDPAASAHIEWRQVDLLLRAPEPDSFDLVSAQFMQLAPEPRTRLFTALAASVLAGGTLLVVGHDPSDLLTGVHRPPMPERFYTADDVARLLNASWTVVVNEVRPRSATTPEGLDVTIHDAVLRATRR